MHPELDGNNQIQFHENDNGAIFSEDEKPHYMDTIKRSMTFPKGDPRSPKYKKEMKIEIENDNGEPEERHEDQEEQIQE